MQVERKSETADYADYTDFLMTNNEFRMMKFLNSQDNKLPAPIEARKVLPGPVEGLVIDITGLTVIGF